MTADAKGLPAFAGNHAKVGSRGRSRPGRQILQEAIAASMFERHLRVGGRLRRIVIRDRHD